MKANQDNDKDEIATFMLKYCDTLNQMGEEIFAMSNDFARFNTLTHVYGGLYSVLRGGLRNGDEAKEFLMWAAPKVKEMIDDGFFLSPDDKRVH